MAIEKVTLGRHLRIGRLVTGLWQVADQERSGPLDIDAAADALAAYVAAGFDTFDMADHYGSAEDIAGRMLSRGARAHVLTKWCPTPGPMTRETVRAGVGRSLERLRVHRLDLLQLHWWSFEHPAYIEAAEQLARMQQDGLISEIGVTNFDTAHLRILVGHGIRIASNQISASLLDRRAMQGMSGLCRDHGIGLLAYGTLAGGLLDARWLDRAEPSDAETPDWSRSKYRRFIAAAGGWDKFQSLLRACDEVARRHNVSLANVASRWVLQQNSVSAVIIGARLGEREHRADNMALFRFRLDDADLARLDAACALLTRLPGDCGDEYRKPPFLTASGDLSHHIDTLPSAFVVHGDAGRLKIDSGSPWESLAGYSRAVRVGDRVLVSGTTATGADGAVVCPGDVYGQAIFIFDRIAGALRAAGGTIADVVRTRVYLRDASHVDEVARAHAEVFGAIGPANTTLRAGLIGDFDVEIEAEAIITAQD